MVGLWFLAPAIEVRILAGQQSAGHKHAVFMAFAVASSARIRKTEPVHKTSEAQACRRVRGGSS